LPTRSASRATVSRLLSYALDRGLVEIRVHDPQQVSGSLEAALAHHYRLRSIQVVPVAAAATDKETLQRVTCHAAAYVNSLVTPGTVIGLAWGTTVAQIADQLLPRHVHDVDVVALNGSAAAPASSTASANPSSRALPRTTARAPIPAGAGLLRLSRDAQRAVARKRASRPSATCRNAPPSCSFPSAPKPPAATSIPPATWAKTSARSCGEDGLVGDIATVFFRADGSWRDVAFNAATAVRTWTASRAAMRCAWSPAPASCPA
jgi:DNA-binding transcriptional regulator LsrR (DeoR family)